MKAHRFLEEKDLEFELVEQDNPTKSCDDAARERGVETSQIVKSLIVERHEEKGVTDGDLVHVLLPGDREISEKKFGEHHLIPPEESEELTGFESGTVHPFSTEIDHAIDFRVLENDKVSFTVGEKLRGVIIDSEDFREGLEKSDFEFDVEDISLTDDRDLETLKEKGLDEEDARFIAERGLTLIYRDLNFEDEEILKGFQELLRHDIDPSKGLMEELIDTSENLNHMQKLVEAYAETGEIEDSGGFELERVVEDILEGYPEALEDLKSGKDSVENFIIGQVMQKTSGKANPDNVKEILEDEY